MPKGIPIGNPKPKPPCKKPGLVTVKSLFGGLSESVLFEGFQGIYLAKFEVQISCQVRIAKALRLRVG